MVQETESNAKPRDKVCLSYIYRERERDHNYHNMTKKSLYLFVNYFGKRIQRGKLEYIFKWWERDQARAYIYI